MTPEEERIEELEQEVSDLENELAEARDEIEDKKNEISDLERELEDTQDELYELQESIELQDQLPLESISDQEKLDLLKEHWHSFSIEDLERFLKVRPLGRISTGTGLLFG